MKGLFRKGVGLPGFHPELRLLDRSGSSSVDVRGLVSVRRACHSDARGLRVLAVREALDPAGPVGPLPVEFDVVAAARLSCDAPAVRRPQLSVLSRVERRARACRPPTKTHTSTWLPSRMSIATGAVQRKAGEPGGGRGA